MMRCKNGVMRYETMGDLVLISHSTMKTDGSPTIKVVSSKVYNGDESDVRIGILLGVLKLLGCSRRVRVKILNIIEEEANNYNSMWRYKKEKAEWK